ncbi:MAG TPA: hypothetical protein VNU94_02615 [Acidobacteriaceae bacterium]|nr:hypothetical protein [Acidobacteriaceae bacterium]
MLTRRSNSSTASPFALGPWRTLLALLCIVLVMATATVELTHHHADGGEHGDCALCVVAHVVIQTVTAPALIALFTRLAAVVLAARVLALAKATIFVHFTRPPPACLNAA